MHLSCLQSAINQEKKKKKFNKEAARTAGEVEELSVTQISSSLIPVSFFTSQAIQQLIK